MQCTFGIIFVVHIVQVSSLTLVRDQLAEIEAARVECARVRSLSADRVADCALTKRHLLAATGSGELQLQKFRGQLHDAAAECARRTDTFTGVARSAKFLACLPTVALPSAADVEATCMKEAGATSELPAAPYTNLTGPWLAHHTNHAAACALYCVGRRHDVVLSRPDVCVSAINFRFDDGNAFNYTQAIAMCRGGMEMFHRDKCVQGAHLYTCLTREWSKAH